MYMLIGPHYEITWHPDYKSHTYTDVARANRRPCSVSLVGSSVAAYVQPWDQACAHQKGMQKQCEITSGNATGGRDGRSSPLWSSIASEDPSYTHMNTRTWIHHVFECIAARVYFACREGPVTCRSPFECLSCVTSNAPWANSLINVRCLERMTCYLKGAFK